MGGLVVGRRVKQPKKASEAQNGSFIAALTKTHCWHVTVASVTLFISTQTRIFSWCLDLTTLWWFHNINYITTVGKVRSSMKNRGGNWQVVININAIVNSAYQSNSLSILISIPELVEWQKWSYTQSSAPKATFFFPQIMSAQDCENEHIQLKHTEHHLDKI